MSMNVLQLLAQAHAATSPSTSHYGPQTAVPMSGAQGATSYAPDLVSPPPQVAPQAPPPLNPTVAPQYNAPVTPAISADNTAAPKPRRSVLDTIGKLADVFAKVGGADALYQSTLDANTARGNAAEDRPRQVDMDNLKLLQAQQLVTTGDQALQDHDSARAGAAVRGLAAIQAGGGDVTKAWPILAQQLHVSPEQMAQIGEHLAADPKGTIAGLQAALNPETATSKTGNVQTYEMLKEADPTGVLAGNFAKSLSDPHAITAYQQAEIDNMRSRLGIQRDTLGNTVTQQDRVFKEGQYRFDNPQPSKKEGAAGSFTNPKPAIHAISGLHNSLGDLIRDSRLEGATGLIYGKLDLTDGQRAIQGKIDSIVGQAIPAAIAAIKASGGASPRAVSEIMGEVQGLTGAIKNRNMATSDYIASIAAAQQRLQQRIQDLQDGGTTPAPSRSSGRDTQRPGSSSGGLPPRIGAPRSAPAASGWGKARVVK